MEASDNAPGIFWAYVLQALNHHGVPLPRDVSAPADAAQVESALLGRLAAHLQRREPPVALVEAADALGDPRAARRLTRCALACADGERLRLPFCLASPWLRRLLRSDAALARPHPWLPPDLRAVAGVPMAGGCGGSAPAVEPLSAREHDVLARAAEPMSAEEIAADLYLSVNTVKTHLKSINRKLVASRRGEAGRRARRLHLL